jgi:hypothetical protein
VPPTATHSSFSFFFAIHAQAARAYFLWRRVMVVYAFVNLLMGANGGFLGGLVGVALAVYYALVCRSHYRALQVPCFSRDVLNVYLGMPFGCRMFFWKRLCVDVALHVC